MNSRVLDRYKSNNILTASPAALVTMLYDRLVLDLQRAEGAILANDAATCTENMSHAQEIIMELRDSLDVTKWSGGAGLLELYSFLLRELIASNVAKDANRIAKCREIIEPLRDAWHQAALAVGT